VIFTEARDARRYAAELGEEFDNQTDYCEACRAYHVGATHDEDVPTQCGSVGIWGFSAVNDCRRAPHDDKRHCDINGTEWEDV
jgi:hypothetical protein